MLTQYLLFSATIVSRSKVTRKSQVGDENLYGWTMAAARILANVGLERESINKASSNIIVDTVTRETL